MKAAFITETGPPTNLIYDETPSPEPLGDELLIRVSAVSVNPIDTYIRSGTISMPLPIPFIVGCDFAGTVESIGASVTRFKVGDRVWGSNQGLLGRQGTFAEKIAIKEAFAYPLPSTMGPEEMSSIALVAITAHLGLVQRANLQKGETLFVSGGAGGVGSMVIQIGKALGAKVIASAGSDERVQICRELGADIAVNYNTDDLKSTVNEHTASGIHVFWETKRTPNFQVTIDLLAENGRMVVMAGRDATPPFPVGPFYVKGCSLHGFAMFKATPEVQLIAAQEVNQWVDSGQLKANIGRRFKLSEAAAAHQLQEDNTLHSAGTLHGKIVLIP
jgi:NADPH:quinone reductase